MLVAMLNEVKARDCPVYDIIEKWMGICGRWPGSITAADGLPDGNGKPGFAGLE
jgi:hypothetical protein